MTALLMLFRKVLRPDGGSVSDVNHMPSIHFVRKTVVDTRSFFHNKTVCCQPGSRNFAVFGPQWSRILGIMQVADVLKVPALCYG